MLVQVLDEIEDQSTKQPTDAENILACLVIALDNDIAKQTDLAAALQLLQCEWDKVAIYKAWALLKKYRRTLESKKWGMTLPREMKKPLIATFLGDDQWQVWNPIKNTFYTVLEIGSDFQCDCEAASFGNICSHVAEIEATPRVSVEPVTASPSPTVSVEPVIASPAPMVGVEPVTASPSPTVSVEPVTASPSPTVSVEPVTASPAPTASVEPVTASPAPTASVEPVIAIDEIILTAGQAEAFERMKAWWLNQAEPMFLLMGYAGTGKTLLMQKFYKWLQETDPTVPCGFAAPTNKAVKVIDRTFNRCRRDASAALCTMTCARLFAIREKKIDGEQVFVRDRNKEPAVDLYEFVAVDEVSMVNGDLWEYFVESAQTMYPRRHRFILMGDPAQLPPVGEAQSQAFSGVAQKYELTEICRYGGPLGELAQDFRENLHRPQLPKVLTSTDPETNDGVYALDRGTWESWLKAAIVTETARNNPDHIRAIAYRNKRVGYLNKIIRSALWGANPPEWVEGDLIIASEPYGPGGIPMIQNSAEGTVLEYWEGTLGKWPVWRLRCHFEGGVTCTVPVLKASAQQQFDLEQDQLSKAKRWHEFWGNREELAWLKPAYALTAHKCQGSTFAHVFVDFDDMAVCRDFHEKIDGKRVYMRNQIAYTSVTRAQKRAVILQSGY